MNLPLVAAPAARSPLPGATDAPAGAHFGTSLAAALTTRRAGRPAGSATDTATPAGGADGAAGPGAATADVELPAAGAAATGESGDGESACVPVDEQVPADVIASAGTTGTPGDVADGLGATAGPSDGTVDALDGTIEGLDGLAGGAAGPSGGTVDALDGTVDALGGVVDGLGGVVDGTGDPTDDDGDDDDAGTDLRPDALALAGAIAAPILPAPGTTGATETAATVSTAAAGPGQAAGVAHARPGRPDQAATETPAASTDLRSISSDREPATGVDATAHGDAARATHATTAGDATSAPTALPVPATSTAPTAAAGSNVAAPAGGAALAASDTVRYLRELGPARSVQRLAVDLDGSTVAVRIDQRGAQASVQVRVLDDPGGRLGDRWTSSVERTLARSFGDPSRFGDGSPEQRRRRDETAPPEQDAAPGTRRRWADALTIEGATR